MSDWRNWRLQQWHEHLLVHFFGRRTDDDPPVVALLATPEEIARATGDRSADATEVRDAFVARVRLEVGSRSLLEDASDYQNWPAAPPVERIPRFVSHLIFTCIAASESSGELASEGSYLQRLHDLAGGNLPDHTMWRLAVLWQSLAAWLKANAHAYRTLKLPDPGSYTRIGHTVKLAFPDRRDQRTLSELLDQAGLQGHEPPVGKVVRLVASVRGQFRQTFLDAFDDFRNCLSRGATGELIEHRFWSAVRDASLRGRGLEAVTDRNLASRFQMLCEERDDKLHPFLVTDAPIGEGSLRTLDLPVPYDTWRYAVVRDGGDPEDVYDAAREVLLGGITIPRLTSLVTQGLIPLVEGGHGYLELAGSEHLKQSKIALAHESRAAALIEFFGRGRVRPVASTIPEWVELRGLQLRQLPADTLEITALAGCWQLYESILRPSMRLRGGVKADDGWLGFREVLPLVTAPGAEQVIMFQANGTREALRQQEDGAWHLPDRDHEGEYQFEARANDAALQRSSARFSLLVGTEHVRQPNEPDAWIVECVGGTSTLADTTPTADLPSPTPAPVVDRTFYLGPAVGQFVGDPAEAAWRVVKFAGKDTGARCRHDLAQASGAARVADASARRKWRRLVLNCRADPSDDGFTAARSSVRQRAMSPELPIIEAHTPATTLEGPRNVVVAPETQRLLAIAAARAGSRTGISLAEWFGYVERVMGRSREHARALTRSWAEAGILDIAYYARWRHCSVIMRPPLLAAFRTEHGFGATILGTLLATSRRSVFTAARRAAVEIEERSNITAATPSLLTMRCRQREQLELVSDEAGIGLSWLDPVIERYVDRCRHDGLTTAPQNYPERVPWSRWSLGSRLEGNEVSFIHCVHPGRPDYWNVSVRNRSIWSYDLNTARLWALALLGEKPFAMGDEGGLLAEQAFVPLPLARFLAVVEGSAPGIDASGRYRYLHGMTALREQVINVIETTFDPRRLPALADTQTG